MQPSESDPLINQQAADGGSSSAERLPDFSLALGGPLYQLYLRTRLLRPPMELLHRRVIVIVGISFLPLVALTALAGDLVGGVGVPLAQDLDLLARLLISLVLLIAAEPFVNQRIKEAIRQFFTRRLVAPEDLPRFQACIALAERMRNSVAAEVGLLLIILTAGFWFWRHLIAMNVTTWYANPISGDMDLTTAGYWYAFVSLPITRFILLRWYYRLLIWYVFLWKVSRLKLRLKPTHPDRAGGLKFLCEPLFAFAPVLVAQTVLLAGLIGNHIWHEHRLLLEFKLEILGSVVCLLLLVLIPLVFFSPQMMEAKRDGEREYGALGSVYADAFHQKWIDGKRGADDELLGSPDIQSLADLGNSFEIINRMQVLPFDKEIVTLLAVLIMAPLLPLVLTMIPLKELASRLFDILI